VASIGRPPIRVYGDRDGLPQNYARALAMDARGHLWIGTEDGAARYDGSRWETITIPPRQGSTDVQGIEIGSDGAVWLGLRRGGVWRLLGGKWTRYGADAGLPSEEIRDLATVPIGDEQAVLLACTSAGLAMLMGERWEVLEAFVGQPAVDITAVAADGSGGLWVGSQIGLAHIGPDQKPTRSAGGFPGGAVTCLAVTDSSDGPVLWVGTEGGGVVRRDAGSWTAISTADGLPSNAVTAIGEGPAAGSAATVWIGTRAGLARLDGGRWTVLDMKKGLPNNWVLALYYARNGPGPGTLWIGTVGGLARLSAGRWTAVDESSGLPVDSVLCLLDTKDRGYWLGTDGGGAVRWDADGLRTYDTMSGLPDNVVWCLLRSADGSVIAGTSVGLARFHGSWEDMASELGAPKRVVYCLLETANPDGTLALWAGGEDGLYRRDPGGWRTVLDEAAVLDAPVTSMLATAGADGVTSLWFATERGLVRLRNGRFEPLLPTSGPSLEKPGWLSELVGPNGQRQLWVGTQGAGVYWRDLDDEAAPWRNLSTSTSPALPNNFVYQARQDLGRRIYLSTNRGIVRLSPREGGGFGVETFGVEDGVPSNEANSGASMVDGEGRVWFGTIRGAAVYDPSSEDVDRTPKPLWIERILLDGSKFDLAENPSLAYDQNHLTFEFALASLYRETETRYQTQLIGLERSPTSWSADAKRDFPALPAGFYVFRVWGRDYAGNVSGPVSVPFTIRSAPWVSWWAFLLYIALLSATGYVAVRLRLRALRKRTDELEAAVALRTTELAQSERRALEASRAKSTFLANMSHELRTPLNAIIGFVQVLNRDHRLAKDQRETLDVIARSGEHLLSLVNDVLSLSKVEAGKLTLTPHVFDLRLFLRGLEEMFAVRADAAGLTLSLDVSGDIPHHVEADEGKLRQVCINLLGNAFKFTRKGGVTMRVHWLDGTASFEVEDTGVGIAPGELEHLFEAFVQAEAGRQSHEGSGLGLAISRSFVRAMGGELTARSTPGEGTVFSFDVPLPAAAAGKAQADRRVVGLAPDQHWRVLVVDDREDNRELLIRLLVDVGFDVREAANGVDAVEVWRSWAPHFIWMDLQMPILDGLGATRRIRELEKSSGRRRTRIVALTASAFDYDRVKILAAGCDDLVLKPFRENLVFGAMARLLGVRYIEAGEAAPREPVDAPSIDIESIQNLPDGELAALAAALEIGDAHMALRIVDTLEASGPKASASLRAMIREYRFDELLALLARKV
jgi:signal transduction histidine kinase/ligand-binding sensor domain-containing protein/ActR/RegA family two-component response regulator